MTIYQNNIAGTGFLTGPTGAPGPAANTYIQEYEYIATQGQTTFTGNDRYNNPMSYVANTIFVVLNGSVLNEVEEYSALDGSTITLNQAAAANDELIVYTFPPFNVANTYTQQQANTIFLKQSGGTISGNLNFANGSNFTVPVGNTAQRPTASPGFIRYNTDLGTLESANATAWANVGSGSASSGGGVSWQPVQNSSFIAVAGNGYAVNTQIANVTVTLPASPTVGNFITLVDYAGTFSSNNLIVYPNGNKLNGNTSNAIISSSGQGISLVYIDSIKGWINYATGFSVGTYSVSSLLVAGGGGGGYNGYGGGGGAGGFLYTSSTLVSSGTAYAVTVGSGGAAAPSPGRASNGNNSSFNSLTAIGGGGGGGDTTGQYSGASGGSGGGGCAVNNGTGGSGTSGQGNSGGTGYAAAPTYYAGGGGGAGAVGNSTSSSNGGIGSTSSISGSSTYYAGGGAGHNYQSNGVGGTGGGASLGAYATVNTGGGGSGYIGTVTIPGASGIVIISYYGPQRATGGTVSSSGGFTIHTFTSSGTFVA